MPLRPHLILASATAIAAMLALEGAALATTTVSNSSDVTKTNGASSWVSKGTSFGTFGAGYSAGWTFYSKSDGSSKYAKAEASATGELFSKTFSLVDLWAKASAGTSSSVSASYELDILGAKILSNTISVSNTLNNLSLEKGYEIVSVEQEIDVGVPVTMTLSADLDATFGLQGTSSYNSAQSSFSFTGTPSAGVSLSASVGVGVSFASAGVEGSITLLNVSVPITNSLAYTASNQSLAYSTTGTLQLSELDGSLGLYAKVTWLGIDLKYSYTLASWNGFSQSYVLFSDALPAVSDVQMTVSGYSVDASYTYANAGGLLESGSTYKIQRADDASGTNTTTISTGTTTASSAPSWSLTSSDNKKFLRFCVTPKTQTNSGSESCSGWASVGPLLQFYADSNYGGATLNYAYESNLSGACITFPSSFNDTLSSFKWYADDHAGSQLVLYENQYCSIYGSKSVRWLDAGGSDSVPAFTSTSTYGISSWWNDKVTSFRVVWDDTVAASNVQVSISGATATASYTYADSANVAEASSTYSWQRADDASGTNAATISTSGTSYTLSTSDNAKYLRFCITPSNGIVTGDQTCSAWTSVGHLLELYKDANYSGSNLNLAYEKWPAQTCISLSGYGWNDTVSSLHFMGTMSASGSTVAMFHDANCTGNAAYYTASTPGSSYDLASLNSYWNDAFTSFLVYY